MYKASSLYFQSQLLLMLKLTSLTGEQLKKLGLLWLLMWWEDVYNTL